MTLAIRKRTIVALGHLVVNTKDDLFQTLLDFLLKDFTEKEKQKDFEKLKTLVGVIATLR